MSVIFGLTAALCWGGADMLARSVTRRIGTIRTLLGMQALGFVGLTVLLLATGGLATHAHVGWQGWAWALLAALLSTVGSLVLYRAFEIGIISVVSPIAATYAAVAVVLALLTGTRLSALHGMGIVVTLVGVGLAAAGAASDTLAGVDTPLGAAAPHAITKAGATQAMLLAALSSLLFGVTFWLFGWRVTPLLGGIAPVWVVRLTAASLMGVVVLAGGDARPRAAVLPTWLWGALAGVALLDTLGYVANVAGLATGDVAAVNVLSSLFSAVTVLLAGIFLREQLLVRQWVGIGVILLGVVLVSL
ncbi:MAG: EamA family transporter [Ktedonobacterales bacterium]|nr:EamA family transporter [Ktedonobacterales bacterium]